MNEKNTAPTILKSPPGPKVIQAFKGLGKRGFLDYIGTTWEEYGDLFRLNLGFRSLFFAMHPDTVQYVSVTNSKNFDKLRSYDAVRKYLTGNGLIASTGDLWRRQRKLMAPFYTPKGIQAYADIMIRDAVDISRRWEHFHGQKVDMEEEMMRVTASIILKSMFSSEIDQETMEMKDCVEFMIYYTTTQERGFYPPDWVPTKRNRTYSSSRKKVHQYINRIILQRRAMPESEWPQDLLTKLMQARDEETGQPMSDSLLRDESITTFFAGHETTARTMSHTWYALSKNKEARQKLHHELDSILGDEIPTLADLQRLPYTLQVIKEVLRLYPPAPFYVRDSVEDDVIYGYKLPKGSAVMLSPFFTHRHPEFWEDPLKFDPDRWAPGKEKERHRYCYHPFASGKRVCIGNNFSLLESHILLAVLARKFDPRLETGYEVTWEMLGTLAAKEGFPMTLNQRF